MLKTASMYYERWSRRESCHHSVRFSSCW